MRTIALILLLVAAAPSALAQTEPARPALSLDPASLTLPPGGSGSAALVLANPTDAPITFSLAAQSATGASAKLARESVTVPAHGRERVEAQVQVPDKPDATHAVRFLAKETSPAARATALELTAQLEVRVGPASPVTITLDEVDIDLPQGGEATVRAVIANAGPAIDAPQLQTKAAQGVEIVVVDAPARLEAASRTPVTLRLRHVGEEPVGTTRESAIGMLSPRAVAPFRVHIADPAAPSPAAPPAPSPALVAGAILVASGAATWTLAWLTRHKWWPLLAALYTRLRPSGILDHPVRRAIADLAQREPGITFGEVARRLDIAPGQLTHHARMLEKAGVVFSSPDGQTRRFFHIGQARLEAIPPLAERALAALATGPRRASELARELGVSRQALHYHIRRLEGQGRIRTRPDGRELWLEAHEPRSSAA